jgi:hypothetical protein
MIPDIGLSLRRRSDGASPEKVSAPSAHSTIAELAMTQQLKALARPAFKPEKKLGAVNRFRSCARRLVVPECLAGRLAGRAPKNCRKDAESDDSRITGQSGAIR